MNGHPNQASKLPYSMIHMHHIVAYLKLSDFFECQRHLTSTSLVTTKTELMKTVKYLVIGKETGFQRVVNVPLMRRLVNRHKGK